MCEIVEISDDEDSSAPENDVRIIPKEECLNYVLPLKEESLNYVLPLQDTCSRPGADNVASSSGINLRSSFIGMGFAPSIVNKAIEEHGEGNTEFLLEAIFKYSDIQQPKTEFFDNGLIDGGNDGLAANLYARKAFHKSESSDSLGKDTDTKAYCVENFPLKEEPDVGRGVTDEKMALLLKMNFSFDEVGFAMDRLGKYASISQLMDFILAARMAKKYEKDESDPLFEDEDCIKDCNNEALFGIMDKTLRLLEMGFSENEISAAFEKCGSEAPLPELADSVVAAGTGPDGNKYTSTSFSSKSVGSHHTSTSFSNKSVHIHRQSLKRRMGECLNNQPYKSFIIKTEEYSSGVVSQAVPSDLPEKLKDKLPKEEYTDEPNNWKPKEEFIEDSSNSVGQMWLEARRGNLTSTNNQVAALQRQVGLLGSIEEDRKPIISTPNPGRSLTSVVSKPPYFFYGSITNLSHDSWVKISKFLYSIQPEFVNSELFSALTREEGYLHNLPAEDRFHIFPKGPMTIEEALPHTRKWWPSWDKRRQLSHISCDTRGISYMCERLERMLAECKGLPSAEHGRELLLQCQAKNLVWVGNIKLAPLEPEQVERIMGYPLHHSRVAGFSLPERLKSLKFSFQTDTVGYHLSVLKRLFPGGVSVLSIFSGIGGAEVALHRLGIRLKAVVSVEPCETKRRIVRRWWEKSGQSGELIQIESIHKLSGNKLDDLLKKFCGFDLVVCRNPYSGNDDSHSLAGLDFSLFVEFVRVLQRVRSTMGKNR